MATSSKTVKRQVRRNRIRAKVSGTPEMPRLSIFKSNKFIYAQIIDDTIGKTLVESSGLPAKGSKKIGSKGEQAAAVGKDIAAKAVAKGISKVVFDRGGYIYTGLIRTIADSAREGGLKF